MEQYSELPRIYDKMIDADYEKWILFIEEYLKRMKIDIKNKNVLELGCGTGNMTLLLSSKGAKTTAVDISDEMLSSAEEKSRQKRFRINFLKQDIRNFKIGKKFDLIFSFCDCYNYILKDKEIIQSFNNVYNHLIAGGYFIFDISTPFKLKNIIGNSTFTMNEEEICYIWDNYIEEDIIEMYITFFIKEGMLYRRFKEKHIQRAHEVKNLIKYLNETGFKEIEVYDDYTFENIKEDSIRAVICAKKEE